MLDVADNEQMNVEDKEMEYDLTEICAQIWERIKKIRRLTSCSQSAFSGRNWRVSFRGLPFAVAIVVHFDFVSFKTSTSLLADPSKE